MNARKTAENLPRRLLDCGAQVDREDKVKFRQATGEVADRAKDVCQTRTMAFPAMCGQKDVARRQSWEPFCEFWPEVPGVEPRADIKQGIHNRIARNEDALRINAFVDEVLTGALRRRKMEICQPRDEGTVDFLGIGQVSIERTKPGFNMGNPHPVVETGQRSNKRGAGITLHDEQIRPRSANQRIERFQGD